MLVGIPPHLGTDGRTDGLPYFVPVGTAPHLGRVSGTLLLSHSKFRVELSTEDTSVTTAPTVLANSSTRVGDKLILVHVNTLFISNYTIDINTVIPLKTKRPTTYMLLLVYRQFLLFLNRAFAIAAAAFFFKLFMLLVELL